MCRSRDRSGNDDPGAVRDFSREMDITYPNVLDTSGTIRVALERTAFPTTYLFDAEGSLRAG